MSEHIDCSVQGCGLNARTCSKSNELSSSHSELADKLSHRKVYFEKQCKTWVGTIMPQGQNRVIVHCSKPQFSRHLVMLLRLTTTHILP